MKIKIGPIKYDVEWVKDLTSHDEERREVDLNGHILMDKCLIKVNSDLPHQRARITLLHEVLHGILFNADWPEHDERLISVLATGLVGVLRENPDLIAYLTGGDDESHESQSQSTPSSTGVATWPGR